GAKNSTSGASATSFAHFAMSMNAAIHAHGKQQVLFLAIEGSPMTEAEMATVTRAMRPIVHYKPLQLGVGGLTGGTLLTYLSPYKVDELAARIHFAEVVNTDQERRLIV